MEVSAEKDLQNRVQNTREIDGSTYLLNIITSRVVEGFTYPLIASEMIEGALQRAKTRSMRSLDYFILRAYYRAGMTVYIEHSGSALDFDLSIPEILPEADHSKIQSLIPRMVEVHVMYVSDYNRALN